MTQSAIPGPQAPIFVLGKKSDYAYVAPTVKDAVDNTNRFVTNGTGSEEWPRVLVLDELDFFDATGVAGRS